MKAMKRWAAAALAVVTAASMFAAAPAQAAKKYFWVAKKTTSYTWDWEKKAWVKESMHEAAYDKNGFQTKWKQTSFRQWDEEKQDWVNKTTSEEYKYKIRNKRLDSETVYVNGKKTEKVVYSHNKKGQETGWKTYDGKGKLVSTTTVKRDKNGYPKKQTTTFKDKSKKKQVDTFKYTVKKKVLRKVTAKYADGWSYTNTYNKKGVLTRSEHTFQDGSKSVSEYTSKGVIKKDSYTSKDGSTKEVTTYDSKGRRKNRTYTSSDWNSKMTFTYDKKTGHEKSAEETWWYTDDEGKKREGTNHFTYDIKVDSHNNITQKIEKIDGENSYKEVSSGYMKIKY